jgi:hypothetical protein
MTGPTRELRGPGGWVWCVEANGGPAGIAAKARAAGLTWLVAPAAGTSSPPPSSPP